MRTAIPLGPAPAPGCDEPTSRCQTLPSIWTLGQYQPVIPGVPFIKLSDGPSTQNHRITMTDFCLCSTCQSRSQAGLCHCTLQPISNRSEPTIARLRYSLGGDRPSQTTHHAGSQSRVHGTWLDINRLQGGISRTTLQRLAPPLQSLPPILHNNLLIPLRSYSKGARGLSV